MHGKCVGYIKTYDCVLNILVQKKHVLHLNVWLETPRGIERLGALQN